MRVPGDLPDDSKLMKKHNTLARRLIERKDGLWVPENRLSRLSYGLARPRSLG
jgi:hypothetical protein